MRRRERRSGLHYAFAIADTITIRRSDGNDIVAIFAKGILIGNVY